MKNIPDEIADSIDIRYDHIAKVLEDLRPNSEFVIRGDSYEGIEWHSTDSEKPTKEEFEKRQDELSILWDKHRYQRKRKLEYPSWEELADAIYHKENGDNSKMQDYINKLQAIKDKYPKS